MPNLRLCCRNRLHLIEVQARARNPPSRPFSAELSRALYDNLLRISPKLNPFLGLGIAGERAFTQRHGSVAMIQVHNKHFPGHFVDMINEYDQVSKEYLERLSTKLMALEDADTKVDFEDSV